MTVGLNVPMDVPVGGVA